MITLIIEQGAWHRLSDEILGGTVSMNGSTFMHAQRVEIQLFYSMVPVDLGRHSLSRYERKHTCRMTTVGCQDLLQGLLH